MIKITKANNLMTYNLFLVYIKDFIKLEYLNKFIYKLTFVKYDTCNFLVNHIFKFIV